MGYTSRLTGEIRIQPPLLWAEFKDSKFVRTVDGDRSVKFEVEEQTTEDAEGERITRRAWAIVDAWDGASVKHYSLERDLEEIVAAFPTRLFAGWLVLTGEGYGDLQRFRISHGRVVSERAVYTWPDGTTEPLQ